MRILIADDDPVDLLLLRNAIERWGYDVTTVSDGTAAWDLLRRRDAPPLALLDWMMPGLDGVEVCRKVRHESEASITYLVLLTAKSQTQDVVLGIESGADDYISKPYEEHDLRVRLRAGQRIVELQQALLDKATHDSLTGIWSRRAISEILERELARAMRERSSVGVILIDIDHFKQINDTRGHLGGDVALCEVSRCLGACLRPSDSLGRLGGDEFLVVLPECDLSVTLVVADRMRQAVAEGNMSAARGTTPLTLSLGAANSNGSILSADGLIKMADEALYRAKESGRNRAEAAIPSAAKALSDQPNEQFFAGTKRSQ